MDKEKPTPPPSEVKKSPEQAPVDISDQVAAIFGGDSKYKSIELRKLLRSDEIAKLPAITLTLDYTNLDHAKWVKAFLEYPYPRTQKRTAAIRATESQMKEAANIFASGVEWIQVEE